MGVKQVKKSKAEIPTIDCELITIQTKDGNEFGFQTANSIAPEPQVETTDAVKLVVKGRLISQKAEQSTITGHQLTITDNVFNPELVLLLQGGTIIYDPENPTEIVGYNPPVAGTNDKGEIFTLNAYSAQYNASGQIVKYEKISYPNCQGVPVAFGSEDGTFRAPEYVINSAPSTGQPPYGIVYVKQLPAIVDAFELATLTVLSEAGTAVGSTKVTVTPEKEVYTNKLYYKTDAAAIVLPLYGVISTGYTLWDGVADIVAATGQHLAVIEVDSDLKALAGGLTTVTAKA